jgi:hypothetical protein
MPKRSTSHPLALAAALLGTLPISLFGPLALAKSPGLSAELRAVIALYLPLPLYALLGLLAVRKRWGWSWLACVLGGAVCALLAGR